jgi:hypothetical protein
MQLDVHVSTYDGHGGHGGHGENFSKYKCCLAALAFRKAFSVVSVFSVATSSSIDQTFQKPLADTAFDHQPVHRAIGHCHIPFVPIPSAFAAEGRFHLR